ncbi:MAG: glycosyltransferase family 4 protein [Methylococcaceae bacterium]|nr:glycosyltransferase family 4 protein [Methylococcaceae bacterium]
MNILLVNHYAGSTRHGMEYRPYYLAREWVHAGHRVQILAASYSHVRISQPEMQLVTHDEIIDGIDYRWYSTPAYKGNGFGRVKNMLAFLWGVWKQRHLIAVEFKPDVVIASSTYPMDIWPARHIAKLAKAKLVFEVHDLWPLSPIELGGMSKWHPFILWVQMAEDYAYRQADIVVSMLPKAQQHMVSRGMDPSKFHYVPNGIDAQEWEHVEALPYDLGKTLAEVKQRGLPVVGYAGTHGLANALDTLLDAAKLAQGRFEVVLIGTGPDRDRLLQRLVDEKIANVTMLPAIPKSTIPAFLKIIDIAFIGLLPEPLFRFGISPNKLMDYMMAGKPIVMAIKAGNDPVAEAKCGFTVAPGNPEEIRDAILALVAMSPSEREAMGGSGKRFILAEQTYPVLAKKFIHAIESM